MMLQIVTLSGLGEKMVKVSKKSMISGNVHEMDIPLTEEQLNEGYDKMDNGVLIQDAFPMLDDDAREFLLTGITSQEWDKTFPEDEEDDPDNYFGLDDDLSF